MSAPAVLFVSADRLSAFRWFQSQLSVENVFPGNDLGRKNFAAYAMELARQDRPAYLLVDLVEEDFRLESVPHLMGAERTSLLERKLEQYYRSTPLRHAQIQDREKDGRRDDRVLFSGLTNASLVTPWVDILTGCEVVLHGIYSVPLVARNLVKEAPASDILLLSWERHAGLRQMYYRGNHLRFSRLTPFGNGENFVGTVQTETARTLQYLHSLSLLPTDRPLDILILCAQSDREELSGRLKNTARVRYAFHDIREAARRLGFKGTVADSDATPLLLHALVRYSPRNQYGTERHVHFHDLWQLRRAAVLGSALITAGCLVWAAMNVWQATTVGIRTELAEGQLTAIETQNRSIVASFPKTPWPASYMREAVLTMRTVQGDVQSPREALEGVSNVLTLFPAIRVNRLSWRMTRDPEGVQSDIRARSTVQPVAQPTRAPGTALAQQASKGAYRVMFLEGEVRSPSIQGYRQAMEVIQQFQDALTQLGMTVSPLQLPLDLRPQATLSGDLEQSAAEGGSPFALRIVQGPSK